MELGNSHKYQEPHYYGHITQEITKVTQLIPDSILIILDFLHNFNPSFQFPKVESDRIGGNGKTGGSISCVAGYLTGRELGSISGRHISLQG